MSVQSRRSFVSLFPETTTSAPPPHISITTSSLATAPNVGGNTSDPIDLPISDAEDGDVQQLSDAENEDGMSTRSHPTVPIPSEMFIQAPPDTNLTDLWEWIEHNFAQYYSTALQTLMTRTFKCYTIADLKTSVTTYNPASLIALLGDTQYDTWHAQLVNLHMIFNYTL